MSRKEALSQFITQIHGRAVVVKLNSGVDYRGEYSAVCLLFTVFATFGISQAFSLVSMAI